MTSDRERWDARYAEAPATLPPPNDWLRACAKQLPTEGRALDVAGGAGRNAVWLARRGLEVTLLDVSPLGLALAERRAQANEAALTTVEADLLREGLSAHVAGPFSLVVCTRYLQRDLFVDMAEVLGVGGLLLFEQPTARNLERHARPSRRFLLEDGELASLLPASLEPLVLEEGWSAGGEHTARLLAQRR